MDKSTPEKEEKYTSRLRKRSPKDHRQNFYQAEVYQSSQPVDRHMKVSQQRLEAQEKVNHFMGRLKSIEESDIDINVSILEEIAKSFSLTFGVNVDKIISYISSQEGDVNVEKLRQSILLEAE